jgi:hypothetical protein
MVSSGANTTLDSLEVELWLDPVAGPLLEDIVPLLAETVTPKPFKIQPLPKVSGGAPFDSDAGLKATLADSLIDTTA